MSIHALFGMSLYPETEFETNIFIVGSPCGFFKAFQYMVSMVIKM